MKKFNQPRQGDVLLDRVQSIPQNAKPMQNKILAYGEATGHTHRLAEGGAVLLETPDGEMYVDASKDTSVIHDKHTETPLAAGKFKVTRQREYDPVEADRQRRVAD